MPLPFFQSVVLWLGAPVYWRPLEVRRSRCMAEKRKAFKQSVSNSSFSSTFSFFFLLISLVWFPRCICNGSIMVVWEFVFCVTIDAYWLILIRFCLRHTCAPSFLSFIFFVYAG